MEWTALVKLTSVTLVSAAAAFFDLKTKRVPNSLTFPAILLGVALTWLEGWKNGLVLLLVLLLLFLFGMLKLTGMGDLKLLMAIAALADPFAMICCALFGSLIFLFWRLFKDGREAGIKIRDQFRRLLCGCGWNREGEQYPFAPFLFLGLCLAIAWRWAFLSI